jgi:hypothetical protein
MTMCWRTCGGERRSTLGPESPGKGSRMRAWGSRSKNEAAEFSLWQAPQLEGLDDIDSSIRRTMTPPCPEAKLLMLNPSLFGPGSAPTFAPTERVSDADYPPRHGAGAEGPWLKRAVAPGTPATGPRHCRGQDALQDHRYRESHSPLTGRGVCPRQFRDCVSGQPPGRPSRSPVPGVSFSFDGEGGLSPAISGLCVWPAMASMA